MTGTTILAIDLGKYKCVSCAYDKATAAAEFRTITTSRAEVERLVRTTAPAVVVIEACSLAGWVSDLCRELGVPCKVANTAAEAWKYKHARRKTDKDDALRLAQLEALGQLPTVAVPIKRVREWRAPLAPPPAPRPPPGGAPDELWRGLLDLALTCYRQAEELVGAAEAKLDQLGKASPGVRLLDTMPV